MAMTTEQIIKQLILSNLQKNADDDRCFYSVGWKWFTLHYDAIENRDKKMTDMIDWFYDKIMELSKNES